MKDYKNEVKEMYKILSPVYDLLDLICFPMAKHNPRLGLAKSIPNEDISILDLCCGTAKSLIAIASYNPKNKLMGIDLSEHMLQIAQRKLKKSKLNHVSLEKMDATKLEIKDQTFDVVTTSLSLHEMPQDVFHLVLREINRVTKKKGKIYIVEWDQPKKIFSFLLFKMIPSLFEPKGFKDFLNLDWKETLSSYGFTLEEVQKYRFSKIIVGTKSSSL